MGIGQRAHSRTRNDVYKNFDDKNSRFYNESRIKFHRDRHIVPLEVKYTRNFRKLKGVK